MSTWLGIDIGATAVKAALVRASYRKVQLAGVSCVEIAQAGGVQEAILAATRALAGERAGFDAIAVALDGQRATVKVVGLPQSAAKQVGEVLPFELESALPFDVEEAVFDYRVLPGVRETKGEELGVLVGVAKTADVVARIDLVKGAIGAEPERVGLGAFPIGNLVPYVPGLADGVVVAVDLGTASSDVLVLRAGEPQFARTLGVGTAGLPGSASKLARELKTTIASYRAQGGDAPTRIFLCGGGVYAGGADAFLASAVGVPTEVIPPLSLETGPLAPPEAATPARFTKAIGLALGLGPRASSLNLRKGPLAFERGFAWVKERVPLLAGLSAVILVSFLFSAWAQLFAASKDRDALEGALAIVTKEVLGEETSDAERANELLAAQTNLADEDPLPHADGFDVMVKLSELIPSTITHDIDELDLQKNHVIVHGVVPTIPDAQTIRAAVAEERCFADAKVTRTTAQVGGTNQKYVLEFDLKCPEDVKGSKKASSASSAASAPAAGEKE